MTLCIIIMLLEISVLKGHPSNGREANGCNIIMLFENSVLGGLPSNGRGANGGERGSTMPTGQVHAALE